MRKKDIRVLTQIETVIINAALMAVIPQLADYYTTKTVHTLLCDVNEMVKFGYEDGRLCPYEINTMIAQLEAVIYMIEKMALLSARSGYDDGRSADVETTALEAIRFALLTIKTADKRYTGH